MKPPIDKPGDDDDDIRRAFQDLRATESEQLPAFGDVIDRPRRSHRPRFLSAGVTAAAAAVLGAALVMWPKGPDTAPVENPTAATAALPFDEWSQLIADTTPAGPDPALTWPTTTDFLLNIPQVQ